MFRLLTLALFSVEEEMETSTLERAAVVTP
jgi:hypothetical protein